MIWAALAFGLPVAAGWCGVRAVLPLRRMAPGWAGLLVEGALGAGLGMGIASVVYFLLLLAGSASRATVLASEAVLLAAAAALLFLRRETEARQIVPARPALRWNWILALALAAGLALVVSGLVEVAAAAPYGEWDAWSIWNLRAKYLAGDGAAWRNAVSPALERSHPEYPLLLSGFVALVWKAAGDTPQWVPIATGFVFLACVLALLAGALAWMRSASSALLAGFLLMASTSYLFLAPMQYADLPLSFYYAGCFALLLLASAQESPGWGPGLLAGLAASLAAWTKNEGMAFAAAVLVCYFVVEAKAKGMRRAFARWRVLALGAAPVLALVVCFKLFLAPATDPLVRQGGAAILHKIAEASRYAQIGKALALEAYRFGQPWSHPLLLLAILAFGLRFQAEERFRTTIRAGGVTLAAVFAGYCGVYVITPSDLTWHLQTSLPRLYGQLWPAFLLLVFMLLRQPEQAAAPERKTPARPAPKRAHA